MFANFQASLPSFLSRSQNHWIGLSDAAVENKFVWQNNYTELGYSLWNPGEPNNSNSDEDCVMLVSKV